MQLASIVLSKKSLFILMAMMLSACTVGKDYQKPDTEQLLMHTDFSDQKNIRLNSASQPVLAWWEQFNDKQLSNLVEDALQHNHDVRIAFSNLQAARAFLSESEFNRYPVVEMQANGTHQRLNREQAVGLPSSSVDSYNAGFDARWEIDLFGRVSQEVAGASATMQARMADVQGVYVSVAAEVARSYIELRGAQLRLDVAQRNVNNQQQTYEMIEQLFTSGRSDALDSARAKVQLQLTYASIPPLQAQINSAMSRLAVLSGRNPDELKPILQTSQKLPSLPASIAIGSARELLKRRPDVYRVERELAASVARYNLNVADLYPRLNILGSIGFSASSFSDLGSNGSGVSAYGPSISWAAFNLGSVKQRIRAADALSQARLATFEKTVLLALEDIDTSMENFSREEQRRAWLFSAASSSATSAAFARERFNAGVDSLLDVLDTDRTMLQAQDQLALSETAMAINLVAIYKALGGGWQGLDKQIKVDNRVANN